MLTLPIKVGEGNYQTKDGRKVKIYATDGGGNLPVHGAIKGCGWWQGEWTLNGGWLTEGECRNDLIDVPKEHTVWVNVYRALLSSVHPSREKADALAASNRIACLEITFEEGEGL